ncbi:MAG: hypothetical protein ACRD19_11250 [Terriglobia bacterium]
MAAQRPVPGPKPTDTFPDLRGWGKGQIWVNGRHLDQRSLNTESMTVGWRSR